MYWTDLDGTHVCNTITFSFCVASILISAFQFRQKKVSIRFSLPNRFFRFDSFRQSDKFATCTLIFK